MSSLSASSSNLPQPRIIPNYAIDRETLEHLKQTSPMHYLSALAALKDGRWHLIGDFVE